MISRTCCLVAIVAICLAVPPARGQEGPPGTVPGAAGTTGPEAKYVEMSHSKDRVLKAAAERYLGVIKLQEWGGASGKSLMAKYVSHDPDLKKVKLSVATGAGKDRVFKDFDVSVDKLNKACQDRVKQIDILQKRLDKLSAAVDSSGKPGGPGAAMASDRAVHPRTEPGAEGAGPGATPAALGAPPQQPAAPQADPSASEPDPLGFGELPSVSPPAAPPGAPPVGPGQEGPMPPAASAPAPAPAATPAKVEASADRKPWRTNITAFDANIKASTDPAGKPTVDWGELRELREMNDILVAQQSPEPPSRSPEAESPAAISERLGDMHWQIVVDKVEQGPGGLVIPSFHPVDVPKPIELRFALDDSEDAQKWVKLPPGATVSVLARLSITEPYKITAKLKLADAK